MSLKSILKGTLAAAAVFCSIAAGAADAPKKEPPKILIAFYSWSGNTRAAALQIQQKIGGDLFEIKTVKPYPRDHRDCAKFAKKELETKSMPALTGTLIFRVTGSFSSAVRTGGARCRRPCILSSRNWT